MYYSAFWDMKPPWYLHGRLLQRSKEIVAAFSRHGAGWLIGRLGLERALPLERGWLGHAARESPYSRPEHVRLALADLGVVFIKLGQFLSTRPDLIPTDYIAELSKLQDAAPPTAFERVCQTVCDELGQSPQGHFGEFDERPLASASIGQVHAAKLKSGESVVVKVQHPDLNQLIERDLELLSVLAHWAETNTEWGRDYNLSALVDEFAYTLRDELDYRREGSNADRFHSNFQGDATIHIPRVFWEYSTSKVLTMERVNGVNVADISSLDAAGIDRKQLARTATRLMMREVFEFGLFHADPHPGNFFVQPDGSITLIDFGMVGRVDERMQDALVRIGLAIVRQDAEQFTDELEAIGVVGRRFDRAALKRDLAHLLDRYAGQVLKELAGAQMTGEVMRIALRHRLQLPGELVMLLRLVGMSETLGARLDPEFRLFEFMESGLNEFWLSQRSPGKLARKFGLAALDAAELSLALPRRASRLLDRAERGDLGFRVRVDDLAAFVHQLQRMVNRLALSVLLAATILALALLMLVYHPPFWEQIAGWVFALIFVVSLGFGGWLMWRIWRSDR